VHQRFVSLVVYFYMFICLLVLAYNVAYLLGSGRRKKREERRVGRALRRLEAMESEPRAEEERAAVRRLSRVEELLALHQALKIMRREGRGGEAQRRLMLYRDVLLRLGEQYAPHEAMERAFFAYFVSRNLPGEEISLRPFRPLGNTLLTYLREDSTIYCRENVLKALCALGGDGREIERMFDLMSLYEWDHQTRLLSDSLLAFRGDRAELAEYLWKRSGPWRDCYRIAIVQMMEGVDRDFTPELLADIEKQPREVQFAILRYFRKRTSAGAHRLLLRVLERGDDLGIAAASSLMAYPGEESRRALGRALSSPNWYIRRNAASSLLAIGLTEEQKAEYANSPDPYAREVFVYMTAKRERRGA